MGSQNDCIVCGGLHIYQNKKQLLNDRVLILVLTMHIQVNNSFVIRNKFYDKCKYILHVPLWLLVAGLVSFFCHCKKFEFGIFIKHNMKMNI